jgi:hypothetical protein
MVNAVNAWQLRILNEAGRYNSAKSGGQKFENLSPLGVIIVHSSCWPVWHWQRQDAEFDNRLHEEKCVQYPKLMTGIASSLCEWTWGTGSEYEDSQVALDTARIREHFRRVHSLATAVLVQ